MASRVAQAWEFLRRNGPGYGLEILVNGILPFAVYQLTDKQLGDVGALIASSVPPIVWSIYQFVRARRIDALSLLIITGIALSLLALVGGGGAKFLQLRENLVTGVIGLIFLGSAALRQPLIYHLALAGMRRNASGEAHEFVALRDNPYFKRTMMVMTLVWGAGLLARTAIAVVLVFTVSIPTFLAIHPVLGYASSAALAGWTFWYARRQRRLGAERRAAAEAAAKATEQPALANTVAAQSGSVLR
jgi:intracellular septation protein A